tara:strand:- start:1792 stop:2511 length:720 start_codon:yes stop_codon:yes gene_type:complete
MEKELKLPKKGEFLTFLDTVSKISDSAIFNVKEDKLTSLVSSIDNTLILYCEYKMPSEFQDTLNIPDIKKFSRVIDTLEGDDISLTVNSNNIEYKGSDVKFKYHLFEEGFLTNPNLNLEKINKFEFDVEFDLDKPTLQQIFKGSNFTTETNKIYFYTEAEKLMAELTDRARHNTDNFSMCIGPSNFTLNPTPVNFDNIRLLSIIDNQFKVKINTEYGVVVFEIEESNIKLKYIISTLTQ